VFFYSILGWLLRKRLKEGYELLIGHNLETRASTNNKQLLKNGFILLRFAKDTPDEMQVVHTAQPKTVPLFFETYISKHKIILKTRFFSIKLTFT
jgi:hypothetical protein